MVGAAELMDYLPRCVVDDTSLPVLAGGTRVWNAGSSIRGFHSYMWWMRYTVMAMYFSEKELANAKIMYNITVERAHLKPKKPKNWTDEDVKRFDGELENVPGKYRDMLTYSGWINSPGKQARAKELGIDVRTWYRICHTGLGGYADDHNKLETDMTQEPLPGYMYGFGMPDLVFKHT